MISLIVVVGDERGDYSRSRNVRSVPSDTDSEDDFNEYMSHKRSRKDNENNKE